MSDAMGSKHNYSDAAEAERERRAQAARERARQVDRDHKIPERLDRERAERERNARPPANFDFDGFMSEAERASDAAAANTAAQRETQAARRERAKARAQAWSPPEGWTHEAFEALAAELGDQIWTTPGTDVELWFKRSTAGAYWAASARPRGVRDQGAEGGGASAKTWETAAGDVIRWLLEQREHRRESLRDRIAQGEAKLLELRARLARLGGGS